MFKYAQFGPQFSEFVKKNLSKVQKNGKKTEGTMNKDSLI